MSDRSPARNSFESEPKKSGKPHPDPVTNLRPFIWSEKAEPHMHRRQLIMAKYGKEINKLMKHEPITKWYCLAIVLILWTMSVVVPTMSWPFYLAGIWVGGIVTHSAFLAVHEVTHHNAFRSQLANDFLSIFVNCGISAPYSMMFKTYHAEHHKYQGWDGIDTDIPSDLELRLFQSFFGKLFFATFQIAFYAARPCLMRQQTLTWKHAVNWISLIAFNALWIWLWGYQSVLFLLLCVAAAGSWNPVAGHFISEHYVFDPKGTQETYSYYGPWNAICFNVGYHNEHHDFPNLPWTALPKLRALAPEFYEDLHVTESWFKTQLAFVLDDNVGVWARVKREEGAGLRKGSLVPTTSDCAVPSAAR